MKIISWTIEGFKSISAPLRFIPKEGITLLTGGNGVGKSTLIEALRWAIYGSDCKGTNKTDLITRNRFRHPEFIGTRVMVSFDIDGIPYQIARHIGYKGTTFGVTGGDSLLLAIDGELSPIRSIADVQAEITHILGMTEDIFEVLIALPQYGESFLTMGNSKKQQLLKLLFDFKWVDEAQAKAKETLKTAQLNISTNKILLDKIETQLAIIADREASNLKAAASFEADKARQIATYRVRIKEVEEQIAINDVERARLIELTATLSGRIKEIDLQLQDASDAKQAFALNKQLRATLTDNLAQAEKALKKLEATVIQKPATTCLVCKAPVTPERLLEIERNMVEQQKSLDEQLLGAVYNVSNFKYKLACEVEGQKLIVECLQTFVPLENERTKVLEKLGDAQRKLANVPYGQFDRYIRDYEKSITDAEAKVFVPADTSTKAQLLIDKTNLVYELEDLYLKEDSAKYWATTGFTNKGLKAHLTYQVLAVLNDTLDKYSPYIGWQVKASLQDDANRTLTIDVYNGEKINFKTLSGGEARRVELVTTIALNEVLGLHTQSCNLLVLDEPFHHLDDESIYRVMELFRSRGGSILITSNQDLDILGVNVIKLQKTLNGTFI